MSIELTMPQLGESVTEGTIGSWLKKEGEKIERDEPLVEVITDKVNAEVPSPVEGVLEKILVQEGETVPIGQVIALIAAPGVGTGNGSGAGQPVAADEQEEGSSNQRPGAAGPFAAPPAYEGEGSSQDASPRRSRGAGSPSVSEGGERKRYSPVVRRLAQEHDIDLSQIAGTGHSGRVTKKDVLAYLERRREQVDEAAASPVIRPATAEAGTVAGQVTSIVPPAAQGPVSVSGGPSLASGDPVSGAPAAGSFPAAPASVGSGPVLPPVSPPHGAPSVRPTVDPVAGDAPIGDDQQVVEPSPIRRTIADRMVYAWREIPHAWAMVEADVTNLARLRAQMKDEFRRREGVPLTYVPFWIKAVVQCLREEPLLNACWQDGKIVMNRRIHVGIAVGVEQGLVVPVIHDADRHTIASLAREIHRLAEKARQGRLSVNDVQGGTITLNNTGALGVTLSKSIVNPPQTAICNLDAVVKRPVVVGDAIAIRHMVNMTLSFDHRVLDGVPVGRFLQSLKARMEAYDESTSLY